MKCVEKGCEVACGEGDLLFCRIHRGKWQEVCNIPFSNIQENLEILTQIRNERLILLRK